jgi:2-haloacid dehalogenase
MSKDEPTAVIFDIGNVLFDWNPRFLYERLIEDDQALDAFLRDVVTHEWHFQHDAGRPFAETSAELIARFPQHEALIAQWGPRFNDSNRKIISGMDVLVGQLVSANVPLFAITNFSGEFFPPFREKWAGFFAPFRDIVVSGDEKLTKPDPAIYHLALDRFGLEAARTVFIDDSEANVAGATSVGLIALHFTGEPQLRRDLIALGLLD